MNWGHRPSTSKKRARSPHMTSYLSKVMRETGRLMGYSGELVVDFTRRGGFR